ncbi:MAG: bifunctional diaminohydroxyphosphoribosylaminopyrimidine deaminase/5-amino-6-(5-phosphoribosylamino)uracil reductase RibD [Methylomonas sp.]|jgi:diaminohydroxyphosphoribosylaminopyrimidine deaminase/5-amino-6-(5-phosphoribosylamino)uracil reductase|uniref:bifunctional diaminohydroxyphosphoribosylaminopyrimidine deaminase/5-amino-6-(5-phosphoribosylamino)uracil reductase RibD n=1 Tax=Methylomonas sp. TaxID=418 RepID=UPI0025D31EC9|nr:bifunctional diaminohydroxyphosphoribosylaminopyrimidine deaminase/5-amino-6-(5-phosphoribosylamino)uracil reductase RibD [Methylomonas sp.]MCK9608121.1 bifunctional diaminohydroxyphosphoribosylaminopyrimidine deaminase/5-amino-6-(5-phosphoribosylamino)uracil reductase RibD [Methylomonas sp.]
MSAADAGFMARALQLARKGVYTTDPNPRVGCVLVKDGQILAEGWHAKAGQAHAEIDALAKLAEPRHALGATAYVTLEPCSHHGRTGPCCDALIQAGISRVVVAMQDPNPLVAGNGLKKMRAAGIKVSCGLLQADAEQLNRGFIKRMVTGLPYVRSKLAMSLDGRTALANGESRWITSPQARQDVQTFRAESSAIVTGIDTVLADDPSLNARVEFTARQPVRVVLDSKLRMPLNAKMLQLPGETWVITCHDDPAKQLRLRDAGCKVWQVDSRLGRVDLSEVFKLLAQQQINTVWIEAGATLNGALLETDLVDEWLVYMAPCVLGDQARGLFHFSELQSMAAKKNFKFNAIRQVGPDLRLTLSR